jgi:hypothetical protein
VSWVATPGNQVEYVSLPEADGRRDVSDGYRYQAIAISSMSGFIKHPF